jgi:hypothetical protein
MSVGEKLRRLSEMSLPEIRFRAAQRLRIEREKLAGSANGRRRADWRARWDPARVADRALREALESGHAPRAEALLPAYWASGKRPPFFFSPSQRPFIAAEYATHFARRLAGLRAEAEQICAHRFRIFAYPEVAAGAEIPWRRDLVHGRESGLDHWSRIPYLDFERCGDSKIVWEPNRHQHFFTLGQAFFLTGEERFAEECLAQLEHWRSENPPRRGINWASSLELAFRAWSWLWMISLLAGSRALSGARLAMLTESLAEHAEFIEENLSTYFSPNTHLLGEGFGLYCIGLLLPELRGAERWRATGRKILEDEMQKQVRPDGAHAEQSSYYHRYATDFFLCAAILADRNAEPFPTAFRSRLERMCEFVLHTQLPGGLHPMTGDADGGRLLALTPNNSPAGPNDQRATLAIAAAFFSRGDFLRAAGGWREEVLWLDPGGWPEMRKHVQPGVSRETSRTFRDGGLVVQRSGWAAHAHVLLFDAGPQGLLTCAHGHADALQIICSAHGVDWLVDPGTYAYTSSPAWRDFFRSTRAHNTLRVDGRDQATRVDVFKWRDMPRVRLELSASAPGLDVAVASHDGYERLPQPLRHRRSVLFVKPDYWIVADSLEGAGRHDLEFTFHFAPGVRLEASRGAWLASRHGSRFLLVPPAGAEARVVEGSENPIQGWVSYDYGHRQPAPVLECRVRAEMPARLDWMLWPVPAGWPTLSALPGRGTRLRVETDAWSDWLAIRAQDLSPSGQELWTDAEVLHVRRAKSGALQRLAMLNGCCAEQGGMALLKAESHVDELAAEWSGEELQLRMKPARNLSLYAPGVARVLCNARPAECARRGDWLDVQGAE